jgi:recombination DNA repair RAD52 pathway protein
MTMSDIQKLLDAPIPRECISEKQGLSYISHRYIKEHLNTVFGWDGWSYEVVDKTIFEEKLACFAHVRLTVMGSTGPVTRDGMALGFPAGQSTVQSFDFAIAESVTDALKRAAVSLGSSMGLELYPMTKGAKPPKPGPPQQVFVDPELVEKVEAHYAADAEPRLGEVALIDRFTGSIAGSTSLSGLKMVGMTIKDSGLSNAAKDGLHDIYAEKKRSLESVVE